MYNVDTEITVLSADYSAPQYNQHHGQRLSQPLEEPAVCNVITMIFTMLNCMAVFLS